MKIGLIIFLVLAVSVFAEVDPYWKARYYEHQHELPLDSVRVQWVGNGATAGTVTVNGVVVPKATAEINNFAVADVLAYAESFQYPDPFATTSIFDFDNDMAILGTATIVADKYLNLYVCTNSASPRHEWVLQKIELKGVDQRKKAKIAEVKDVKAKAQTANSVPALRAEVARLAELIEQITEGK